MHLVPRTGDPIAVAASASAARDAGNELVGIRWLLRDVSERESAERALLELANERDAILDAAPEGICRLDADGQVEYANPAAGRLLGRTQQALRGRQLIDILADGCADTEVEGADRVRLERALGALRPESGEWDYVEPSGGKEVSLRYTCRPLLADGDLVGAVVTFVDISDLRRIERDLRHRADHDALTGLLNRSAFERELDREMAFASRYRTACAVLMLDVDSLKIVNDLNGHLAGDALLRAVALAMRARLRRTDVAGRLGGDEFGVLLPRADETAARTVAAEILAAIRDHPVGPGAGQPGASVSLGIALVKLSGLRTTDVLRSADEGMYRAKRTGGDRIVVVEATPL
jgi:diguanylate cyclase (GGDEF)-like protein/PAS domain S-box-containing protein